MARPWQDSKDELITDQYNGTQEYQSPEIIATRPYKGSEADLYALVICLYTLVFGTLPFKTGAQESDPDYTLFLNSEQEFWEKKVVGRSEPISDQFKDLFSRMVRKNPEDRLSWI